MPHCHKKYEKEITVTLAIGLKSSRSSIATYLARPNSPKGIRKGLTLIFEPSVFGFKGAPSVAAAEPS